MLPFRHMRPCANHTSRTKDSRRTWIERFRRESARQWMHISRTAARAEGKWWHFRDCCAPLRVSAAG